jgi:hypothetical protein
MTLKLGQLLIKENLITPQQLEEALKYHMIYGLKLGSSLVEMGYVSEEQLAQLLSDKLGVPRASRKELTAIPKEVISRISSELAAKFRVIPFFIDHNRLCVAMSDPTDFRAVEELGFITDCVINTFIAPDVLISKALSKFYHVSSAEVRYQMLRRNEKKVSLQPSQTVTFPMKSATGELINITVPADFEGFASYSDQGCFQDVSEPTEIRSYPAISKEQRLSVYTIDQLSIDFAKAGSREEVADVFIRYLGQEFDVGGIFIVFGDEAVGWRGISHGKRLPGFEMFNWSLKKPSVLQKVTQSKDVVFGPFEVNPANKQILFLLNSAQTDHIIALPVIMQGKVVAIIVVSADGDLLRSKMVELENLVYKMSLALQKLIIELKILMT